MQLPKPYPYNASWKIIAMGGALFGGGTVALPFIVSDWEETDTIFMIVGGLMTACVALILVQRCFVHRSFHLEPHALLYPQGLLKTTYLRIPYREIRSVRENTTMVDDTPVATFLIVKTNTTSIAINPDMLPDEASYLEIKEFLLSLKTTDS